MTKKNFDLLDYKWSHALLGKVFGKCIWNIVHNSKLYDLASITPRLAAGQWRRPARPGAASALTPGSAAAPPPACGKHGTCMISTRQPACKCNPAGPGRTAPTRPCPPPLTHRATSGTYSASSQTGSPPDSGSGSALARSTGNASPTSSTASTESWKIS